MHLDTLFLGGISIATGRKVVRIDTDKQVSIICYYYDRIFFWGGGGGVGGLSFGLLATR